MISCGSSWSRSAETATLYRRLGSLDLGRRRRSPRRDNSRAPWLLLLSWPWRQELVSVVLGWRKLLFFCFVCKVQYARICASCARSPRELLLLQWRYYDGFVSMVVSSMMCPVH